MPIVILVVLVLVLFLPWPWNLIGFIAVLVLGVTGVLVSNRTVRGRRKEVGAGTLIGREAVVITECRPDGQVRIDGEIWAARAEGGAAVGAAVRVVGRERLTLFVEPLAPGEGEAPVAGTGLGP